MTDPCPPTSPAPKWIEEARATLLERERDSGPGGPRLHVGHRIDYYETVPSTMPIARGHFASCGSSAAGAVVIADRQLAGRGRSQRSWNAPAGRGLLGSYVLCGDLLPVQPPAAGMLAGLATLAAVRRCGPQIAERIHLKWPNDLVAVGPGGPAKLAGILVENVFHNERLLATVLGIGINANQTKDELPSPRPGGLPPTSIMLAGSGAAVKRGDLLVALCRELDLLCAPGTRPSSRKLHRSWEAELLGMGSAVIVQGEDGPSRGRAVGATQQGALVVRTAGGETVNVHAGDAVFDWSDS